MNKENRLILSFFVLVSIASAIFYYFHVNFSIDLIILFLAEKIYLGKWLARGIIPLFNSHIYAGIPFLFDVGMGNLHPFNIFFILSYPLSFSVWIFASFLLMLSGFYFFFRQFTKTSIFALICVLIFFFSGSGYWRINNPTIFLVIAHFGFYFYFLRDLIKKTFSFRFILLGILIALSGHIQFVLYGYILSILIAIFVYKISFKRLFLNYLILGIGISGYFILSLPIVINSTRITSDKDYITMGRLPIQQVIEFLLPLFFGYVKNGSSWNVGQTFVVLISSLFTFFLLILGINHNKEKRMSDWLIMVFFLLCSFGLFNFPFFRAPSQILLLFHIWGLIYISGNEQNLRALIEKKLNLRFIAPVGLVISICTYSFFSTSLFSKLFVWVYTFIKKRPPNLFFDLTTIQAIGKLIGLNFIIYIALFTLLLILGNRHKKKYLFPILIIFILFEGIFVNYFHNYFIPQDVIIKKFSLPPLKNAAVYRIQTGADVIPYFGFHNYMGSMLFRPPFSKEKSFITPDEEKYRTYLTHIMSFYPSTWSMTYGLSAVQGYNTFVTKDIADYFKESSSDYGNEYSYIIKRNNLFGQSEKGLAINGIETSRVTLNDPRWEKLGVRYFLSDRPLKKYTLLEKSNGRYIYENSKTLPIYRITDGNVISAMPPYYNDPNQWKFHITQNKIGKEFQMVMNPGGFIATLNGKEILIKKEKFLLRIPLHEQGDLIVRYSPILHLVESVMKFR